MTKDGKKNKGKEETPSKSDEFRGLYKSYEGLDKQFRLATDPKTAEEVYVPAITALKKVSYDLAPSDGKPASVDAISENEALQNAQTESNLRFVRTSNYARKNINDLLSAIPEDKGLESLVFDKNVSPMISSKDRGILAVYEGYVSLKNAIDNYEKTGRLPEELQEREDQAVIEGMTAKDKEKLKEKGVTDPREYKFRESLAAVAVRMKRVSAENRKKYALAGFKKMVEDTKKAYEDVASKEKRTIYDIARGVVKDLVKNDSADVNRMGLEYLYALTAKKDK